MPRKRLTLPLLAVATAAVFALSACGGSSSSSHSSESNHTKDNPTDVLKVGLSDSISNLLPGSEAGETNYWVAAIQTEGLVTVGTDGTLKPALATSWKQASPTSYVYEIDPNRKFQNGSPVTINDVLASIAAARDEKISPSESYLWSSVKDVKQTGSWEITITLSAPNASFQYTPSTSAGLWVYPASYWKSAGDKVGTATALPIGTGPYQFTRFSPDSGITLTKSKYWTGKKPAFKEVDFKFIPDNNTEKLALEKGDIDLAAPIPTTQYASWQKDKDISTFFTPNRGLITIDFDTSVTPFDDQHVRNAVAYAFDRKAFVAKVLDGHGRVATSLLTPEQFAGVSSVKDATKRLGDLPQYSYSPKKAKAAMAASSVPNGFTTQVEVPSNYPELVTAAQLLQQNLKPLGITLTIKTGTTDDWYGTMGDGKHGLGFMLYDTVSADPGELSLWFLAPGNPAKMTNPEIDAAIAKSNAATDLTTRMNALVEANRIQNEKNYYSPVSWDEIAIGSHGVKLDDWSSYTLTSPWVLQVAPK